MLAGIFATKKRAACLATLRANKKASCRSSRAGRIQFRATDRTPEAKPTPPPDPGWIELPQAIRNRAAALRGRPVELSFKLLRIRRSARSAGGSSCARRSSGPRGSGRAGLTGRSGCASRASVTRRCGLVMMAAMMMMGRARRCVRGRHAGLSRRCCHARLRRWCRRRSLGKCRHRHRGGEESCGED